jgi:hypothetical protein
MSQVRDSAFMPSSRSSSIGADSFHHDTTPETKGTIFSPNDKSVNTTTKVLSTLYFNGPANPIIRYPGQTADAFASSLTTAERDPFVSAATINKSEQKLSPTASAFRPPSGPVVAHGSLDAVHGPNTGLGANRQSFSGPVQTTPPFSTDLGLSRCLVVYSTSHPVMMNQLEEYIMVSLITCSSMRPVLCTLTWQTEAGSARHPLPEQAECGGFRWQDLLPHFQHP